MQVPRRSPNRGAKCLELPHWIQTDFQLQLGQTNVLGAGSAMDPSRGSDKISKQRGEVCSVFVWLQTDSRLQLGQTQWHGAGFVIANLSAGSEKISKQRGKVPRAPTLAPN